MIHIYKKLFALLALIMISFYANAQNQILTSGNRVLERFVHENCLSFLGNQQYGIMINELSGQISNQDLINYLRSEFPQAGINDVNLVVGGSRAAGAALTTSDVDSQIVVGINGERPDARAMRISLHNFLVNRVFDNKARYRLEYKPAVTIVNLLGNGLEGLSLDVALVLRINGGREDINLMNANRHVMGFGGNQPLGATADPNDVWNRWIPDNAPDFYHEYHELEQNDPSNRNEMRHKVLKLLKLWLKSVDKAQFSKKTIPPSSFITFTMFRFYNDASLHIDPNNLIESTISFLCILINEVTSPNFRMPFAAERGVFRNFNQADKELFARYLRSLKNALIQLREEKDSGIDVNTYVVGILSAYFPSLVESITDRPLNRCRRIISFTSDWNANAQIAASSSINLNNFKVSHSANGNTVDDIQLYISASHVSLSGVSSITSNNTNDKIVIEAKDNNACDLLVREDDIKNVRAKQFSITFPSFIRDGERIGDLGNYLRPGVSFRKSATTFETNNDDIYINQEEVLIYPNPSDGKFMIKPKNKEGIKNLIISDAIGKTVVTIPNIIKEVEINISKFASGMYFINYNAEGKLHTKKIIKR
ncbi:conserved protein of unknown function precursor containing a type A C-terminal secretion signal [Tenacibaculum sp. 190524A02b]|uniref:T9SS type A sorting domain-containing protein n=1 Tax=Tenacibaculum vairaonense TaxID=3137860 RepID=UPI0032B19D7C